MKIFDSRNNIYDAVDAFVEYGVIAIGGTKTPAVNYINRLKECLSVYDDVKPTEDYENIPNHGYLYFLYDLNRFKPRSEEVLKIVHDIDETNPI